MEEVIKLIPPATRLLEFGAGTGEQAALLVAHGFDVVAIDLPSSHYAPKRVFPVLDYDGTHIPLEDRSVDAIFSSNVLEHVENLPAIFSEFRRILRPGGLGVHIVPTPAWRFWTFVAGVPTSAAASWQLVRQLVAPPPEVSRGRAFRRNAREAVTALLPLGHGTSREGISELWTFSRRVWKSRFEKHGFKVIDDRPMGLFYTGHMALAERLPFAARERLSHTIGSACRLFVVKTDA